VRACVRVYVHAYVCVCVCILYIYVSATEDLALPANFNVYLLQYVTKI